MKFMKKKYLIVLALITIVGGLLILSGAHAQSFLGDTFTQLDAAGGQGGAGYGAAQDPRLIISTIIKLALTLIGTIIFVLMLYAGFLWMTAQGNDEQVSQAKVTIRNAVIGLAIVLSAYGLTILATNLAIGRSLGSGASRGSTLDGAVQGLFK